MAKMKIIIIILKKTPLCRGVIFKTVVLMNNLKPTQEPGLAQLGAHPTAN